MAGYRADGQGRAAYPPTVLVALLLYCHSKGIRSTRRIEQACLDDVGCQIITANRRIDHSTVARFVRRHRQPLRSLFVQVLALCDQYGLVDLAAVAVDGSPMNAHAGRSSNRSLGRLETVVAEREAEIAEAMRSAAAYARAAESGDLLDADEPPGPDRSTARLSRLSDQLLRARSAKDRLLARALPSAGEIKIKVDAAERIVARAEKRLAAETSAHQAKLDQYAERIRQDLAAGRRATATAT
ncbi:transposase [Streptomyces sp. NPDC057582]|uniref:transposase n=1 Tax=Streptomyces sp. NPDC057582 TaxID=3346174 RepID=UPI00369A0444